MPRRSFSPTWSALFWVLTLMSSGLAVAARAQPAAAITAAAPPTFKSPDSVPPSLRWPRQDEARRLEVLAAEAQDAESERRWPAALRAVREGLSIERRTFGPLHPQVAATFNWIARLLAEDGRPREAAVYFRRAVEIATSSLGPDHPITGRYDGDLAADLDALGDFALAGPLFETALQINRSAFGASHLTTATALDNLANHLKLIGDYSKAEPYLRESLEIRRKGSGEASRLTAVSYNNLAVLLDADGRSAEALELHQHALAIRRASLGEADLLTAQSYDNLAGCLDALGRYQEAESLHRSAMSIRNAAPNAPSAEISTGLANLAFNLNAQGRVAEAEPLYRRALEMARAGQSDFHPSTATLFNNLASNLNAQGRYSGAEALYRRALLIRRATLGEAHADTGASLNNLAFNLNAQHRFDAAEGLLRTALDIDRRALGDRHPTVAAAYTNLAINLDAQSRWTEAEDAYRKALAIREATVGDRHPDTASAKNNLAYNLMAQGRATAAEPLYSQALAIRLEALGERHPLTAAVLNNLAFSLAAQDRLGEAEALSARAVTIARTVRQVSNGAGESGAEAALRKARAGQGDGPEPLRYIYGGYVRLAYLASAKSEGLTGELRDQAFLAAQDSMISKAGQAMANAAARAAAGRGTLGAKVERQQRLAEAVRQLDIDLITAQGEGDAIKERALKTRWSAALEELTQLDQELARDYPSYAQLVSPLALTRTTLQERLAPDEGLLLIVSAGEDMFSFAVSKTQVTWSRLAGGDRQIGERVEALRCQVDPATCGKPGRNASGAAGSSAGKRAYDRAAAYGLYRDLVAPVEGALSGVTKLYVTTSGPLSGLPLGVLVTAPPGEDEDGTDPETLKATSWFSDKFALTTLPTVSSLRPLAPQAPEKAVRAGGSAFRGYGAPTLAGRSGGHRSGAQPPFFRGVSDAGLSLADPDSLRRQLAPLPGTKVELQAMADALKATKDSLRLGAADTERAVRADPTITTAAVIAFATHGLLPTDRIEGLQEPGLVFTPPQTASDEDDGVLAASEVSRMSFSADWIILSACNTASSDGTPGADGLSSLSRAFLYAGAHALLASHWRVSDQVTAALTVETLTLKRDHPGITKAEALKQAMINIRNGERPDGSKITGWTPAWTHPSAWAPFSLIANSAG